MKRYIIIILNIIFLLLLAGCANKVAPEGGAKDVETPVLVSMSPPPGSTGISSGEILITFDEYVQIKEVSQVVISPVMQPKPQISIRKKSILIELPDSLKSETTYSINFGNNISDLNEGNFLPGFRYVFSTGSFIDSLFVSGKIVNAQTQKPEKNALAILYAADTNDSLLLKKAPDYFARSGENGNFMIHNVAEGKYRVFALMDKNDNYILDMTEETAGFLSEPIQLTDSVAVILQLSPVRTGNQLIKSALIENPGKLVTAFNKPLTNPEWKYINFIPEADNIEFSADRDTIIMYIKPPLADSVRIVWSENGILIDTASYLKPRDVKIKPGSQIKTGWSALPARGEMLLQESNPQIKWMAPIIKTDTSKFTVLKDSLPVLFQLQFTDTLQTKMQLITPWPEGKYSITALPGAVTDWNNNTNDTVTINFDVAPEKEKGSISFKFSSPEPGPLLLQLVNDKDEIIRQRVAATSLDGIFEKVDPGVYKLRYVVDSNQNNRWDPGDFMSAMQPEIIRYYSEPIMVRSNWDVEIEWLK